jgi:hypothetical protein
MHTEAREFSHVTDGVAHFWTGIKEGGRWAHASIVEVQVPVADLTAADRALMAASVEVTPPEPEPTQAPVTPDPAPPAAGWLAPDAT